MTNKNVLIIYPIRLTKNSYASGGVSHCLSNVLVYKQLGFRVTVLSSFQYPLVEKKNSALFLHILPVFRPFLSIQSPGSRSDNTPFLSTLSSFFRSCINPIRSLYIKTLISFVLHLLKPQFVHQRANTVCQLKKKPPFVRKLILEINDEYCPLIPTDVVVSVRNLSPLYPHPVRHLSHDWPVPPQSFSCTKDLLAKNLSRLKSHNPNTIKLIYLGFLPATEKRPFHDWLLTTFQNNTYPNSSRIHVDVYSGYSDHSDLRIENLSLTVRYHGFVSLDLLPPLDYTASLIFYSSHRYSDHRLSYGSPTKLSNYIDLSLPVVSNRPYLSSNSSFLPTNLENLLTTHPDRLYDLYLKYRQMTLPSTYADGFKKLLDLK